MNEYLQKVRWGAVEEDTQCQHAHIHVLENVRSVHAHMNRHAHRKVNIKGTACSEWELSFVS